MGGDLGHSCSHVEELTEKIILKYFYRHREIAKMAFFRFLSKWDSLHFLSELRHTDPKMTPNHFISALIVFRSQNYPRNRFWKNFEKFDFFDDFQPIYLEQLDLDLRGPERSKFRIFSKFFKKVVLGQNLLKNTIRPPIFNPDASSTPKSMIFKISTFSKGPTLKPENRNFINSVRRAVFSHMFSNLTWEEI